MTPMRVVMSERQVSKARNGLKIAIGVAAVTLCISGFRLVEAKMHAADLDSRIAMQEGTLKNLGESIKNRPTHSDEPAMPTKNSVIQLQSEIERAAVANHCTVNEFQASPDRGPYLSVFTLDTNRPSWEQVAIHVTLKGPLSAAMASVEALSKSGIPVEPDSLEIARQYITEQGAAIVLLRLDFRVLTRSGGKS